MHNFRVIFILDHCTCVVYIDATLLIYLFSFTFSKYTILSSFQVLRAQSTRMHTAYLKCSLLINCFPFRSKFDRRHGQALECWSVGQLPRPLRGQHRQENKMDHDRSDLRSRGGRSCPWHVLLLAALFVILNWEPVMGNIRSFSDRWVIYWFNIV